MIRNMSGLASRCKKLEHMVARLKKVLECAVCLEVVGTPALQCEEGHLMCSMCRSNLQRNSCPTCEGSLLQTRIRAVEQVVELLGKECPYVSSGCQEPLEEAELETHRVACPHRQFTCPRPPCPWVGYKPEVMAHMRESHPDHILSSDRQTVKVPAKWDEVSSWTMFLNDEILVLKFRLDRATNMLFGSFVCLGMLNPLDDFLYHMTVKKGEKKMTLSGNILPEMSVGESDIAFSRNMLVEHSESQSSSQEMYVAVDVTVEDNWREAVVQGAVDVQVQTETRGDDDDEGENLPSGVQDEAATSTSQQAHGENQPYPTALMVCDKVADWMFSYWRDNDYCVNLFDIKFHEIRNNIKSSIEASMTELIKLVDESVNYHMPILERIKMLRSAEAAEIQIKLEHIKAVGGCDDLNNSGSSFIYFLILEQTLSEVFYNMIDKPPMIDSVKLEELKNARVRRMRLQAAQRLLRRMYLTDGVYSVGSFINRMGCLSMKTQREICSLQSAALKIPWKDLKPIQL